MVSEQQYKFMLRKTTTNVMFAFEVLVENDYREGQKLHLFSLYPERQCTQTGTVTLHEEVRSSMLGWCRTWVRTERHRLCAVEVTDGFSVEMGLQGSAQILFFFAVVMVVDR